MSAAAESGTDGFHSFDELYESRALLHAYAVQEWRRRGWEVVKSWRHHDGEPCFGGGWFIVTVITPEGPAAFHYPEAEWDLFDVRAEHLAPEWDGHDTAEAHRRLRASVDTDRTCGHYASAHHERTGRARGDEGCPLPAGHFPATVHQLSASAWADIEAGAVPASERRRRELVDAAAAAGPAIQRAVAALESAGLDPAHYDIRATELGFEAWRRDIGHATEL